MSGQGRAGQGGSRAKLEESPLPGLPSRGFSGPGPLQVGWPLSGEGCRRRPLPSPKWPGSSRPAPPAVVRGPRPLSLAGAARSNQLKSRIDGCPSGAAAGRASWKRLGRGPSRGSCRLGRLPPTPHRPLGLPSSRWREAPAGRFALRAPGKRRLCLAGNSGPARW